MGVWGFCPIGVQEQAPGPGVRGLRPMKQTMYWVIVNIGISRFKTFQDSGIAISEV